MNIGLDWDETFTRDPIAWAEFIKLMTARGHSVMIVTWRDEEQAKEVHIEANYWKLNVEGIYATDRKAKEKFMYAQGIRIDVWIDDNPRAIIQDMQVMEESIYG